MARSRIQAYLDLASTLRCPLCGSALRAEGGSLVCSRAHRFDISAKGFLTLVPNVAPLKGYDAAFFESRARIMDAGFYHHVLDAILQELPHLAAGSTVVDAGCGEGYYAKSIRQRTGCRTIGIDYSKDAIRIAARGGNAVHWLVADLAHMPLAANTAACIINVFTPANYQEFQRVLAPGGTLVKVVPGSRHMQELRALTGKPSIDHAYSNESIVSHLERHAEILARTRAAQTLPVDGEQARDLVRMSPVTFGCNANELEIGRLTQITVDAEVLVARFDDSKV